MNFLFVVAHPDDEILGCIGTINQLLRRGHYVAVQILSTTSKTRETGLLEKTMALHWDIGITRTIINDLEMMRFGEYDRYEVTKMVEDGIREVRPDYVFTHSPDDIHNDHRVLSQIVMEACKLPMRGTGYDAPIRGIYYMEILTSTEWAEGFTPNTFVEITEDDLRAKADCLTEFDDVIRPVPHPRNLETFTALARYRGAQCGCKYAEAFRKVFEYRPEGRWDD